MYKKETKGLTPDQAERILRIIDRNGVTTDKLLNTLIEIQSAMEGRYISEEVASIVSDRFQIPMVQLYDILTFYAMLSVKPQARFQLEVCNCASCYLNDAKSIINILERELGIKMNSISSDRKFSLKYTSCVGACDIGPIIKVGDNIYGNLTEDKIKALLERLRNMK